MNQELTCGANCNWLGLNPRFLSFFSLVWETRVTEILATKVGVSGPNKIFFLLEIAKKRWWFGGCVHRLLLGMAKAEREREEIKIDVSTCQFKRM